MDVGYGTVIKNVVIGKETKVWHHCNLYNSHIGRNCKIACFTEIGGSTIGDNCKIEAYTFIPPGITVGDNVFIGPHVTFTNDKYPRARDKEWTLRETFVQDDVSIGANSTVLSGLTIHRGAMIGAGSVVTEDVPAGSKWYGPKALNRGRIH